MTTATLPPDFDIASVAHGVTTPTGDVQWFVVRHDPEASRRASFIMSHGLSTWKARQCSTNKARERRLAQQPNQRKVFPR